MVAVGLALSGFIRHPADMGVQVMNTARNAELHVFYVLSAGDRSPIAVR
jgi:hypothetical protein